MSMIESLVAMLILAFGVLGMVGVQIRGMIESQNTAQITVASQLANDLFERVKTNPSAVSKYNLAFSVNDPLNGGQWAWLGNYQFGWASAAPIVATSCLVNFCNNAARAIWDVAAWKQELANRIPGGESRILVSPDDTRQLIVIIGWPRKENASVAPYIPVIPNVILPPACSTTHVCHVVYGQP